MAIELKKKAKPPTGGGLKVGGIRVQSEMEKQVKCENEEVFGPEEFDPADDGPDGDPNDDLDYDPEEDDDSDPAPSLEMLPPKSLSAAPPAAMPRRKGPPIKKPMPAAAAPTNKEGATAEKSRLSCELSRAHHRRLKIHAATTGKSILSIIEGWIDEHCPPL